ncbi:MAG TPA: VOC family protein [Actinomycetales bacterium]|nr:VOC family protein [Actinomycetales bacterium]
MGGVVHFEIPADDVERAQGFYRDVFGWRIDPMPDMSYAMLMTTEAGEDGRPTEPGVINGGMMRREGEISSPVITIAVDDIEATLKQVSSNGGTTVQGKMPVGDMGFAAYFTDPEGNILGLWQNAAGA